MKDVRKSVNMSTNAQMQESIEANLLNQLKRLQRNANIVKLRKFVDHPNRNVWRMYLEHCEHGDLQNFKARYNRKYHGVPG